MINRLKLPLLHLIMHWNDLVNTFVGSSKNVTAFGMLLDKTNKMIN